MHPFPKPASSTQVGIDQPTNTSTARPPRNVWSKTYERELKSIFAIEDELVRSIVHALKPKLVQGEAVPLVKPTTANLAAYDLYLKGRFFWNKRTADALARAIAYFQQAIERDATYALAYVGLADSTALLIEYGSVPPTEVLPKAKQAVLKALELDGTLAEAHEVLGLISQYEHAWPAAEHEFRRTIELQSEYPSAHHRYAILLAIMARVKEAVVEAERVRQLDPTSLIINNLVILTLVAAREYGRAIEEAKKTLELEPTFQIARYWLARAYMGEARYPSAPDRGSRDC